MAVCTCGRGDDAPAIVHADHCPCVDWVSGELEGGWPSASSPFELVFPIDRLEDDRGKNVGFNEEDDAHAEA